MSEFADALQGHDQVSLEIRLHGSVRANLKAIIERGWRYISRV
jgi:hypothetical protein